MRSHREPGRFTTRSYRASATAVLAHTWLVGCTPADPASDTGSTDATASTDPTDPSTAEPTTTSEPTTGTSPTCGDGTVADDEACDDGNGINGDGCNSDCQPSGVQLWEYRSDGPTTESIDSIAVDVDGNIVIGGKAGNDGWVARFDPELATLWSMNVGERTLARAVALTEGAIYAAGSRFSDVDAHDVWVARLAADGSLEWEDTLASGLGDDWVTQAVVVDGDVIVTGLALADMLWTRRYGADGAVQWTQTHPLGGTYKNIWPLGPGLAATADAVIAGWSQNKGDTFPELLVAYPPGGGAPSWLVELPMTSGAINALATTADGGLAMAANHDFTTLTVRRSTATGELLWSSDKCVGMNARDIAVDGQGDIVVIGDGPATGGTNIRLCKFDADGNLRWGKDIDGGFGDDRGYAVAIAPADRIVAGGVRFLAGDDREAWLAVFSP